MQNVITTLTTRDLEINSKKVGATPVGFPSRVAQDPAQVSDDSPTLLSGTTFWDTYIPLL